MDPQRLRGLLEAVAQGRTDVDTAMQALARLPFADLGFARVDHHRALRTGVPEVVLAEGKQTDHLVAVVAELAAAGSNVLCTRASPEQAAAVRARLPGADYHATARLITLVQRPVERRGGGEVLVLSAGTSDLRVAEEAALVAEHLGCQVGRLYDVGVAGLHRLLAHLERLRQARVLIVVAGMEGALASVAAGVSGRPVIAVPTSIGYGASFGGLAALLAMLSSCAAGVTVVNIDNGFGAGYAAALVCGDSRPD
ncbi:MAG: nickel pincer cofactor biosynthesis protein LarB [Myxococcales bacterium]|nr:nickel pincer cofactor biosynthesis protein LarB [Myxococcota bacterium]MDW8283980.1 nickel pincer cofactor biosynthesis protein LarB [Myxococcales bacterium]